MLEKDKKEVENLATEDRTSPEHALNFINKIDVPYGNILCQLFVWGTTNNLVAGYVSIATSEETAELQEQLHEEIDPPTRKRSPSDSPNGHKSRLTLCRHSLSGLAANIQANLQSNLETEV